MKTVTLLRHAEAEPAQPGERDFDRRLTEWGQREAEASGCAARADGSRFDRVIASPAARVIETLEYFASGYGSLPVVTHDSRVYLASVAVLIDLIHGAAPTDAHLLIVGHNPGLGELVLDLAPGVDSGGGFPTAAFAEIGFDVDAWTDVAPGLGRLKRFVRPGD